jgi:hypothetical protein
MKLYKKMIVAPALGCLVAMIGGCSSSTLVEEWSYPSYHEPPLKKVLVIDISKNISKRQIWEDAFSDEFSEYGVRATSSYHLFPGVLPDTAQVLEAVHENDFDGILVTRLLLSDTSSDYVDSSVTTEQVQRYNLRTGYYTYYKEYVQHPGYLESQIIRRRSIEVWTTGNGGRIIWRATSNTPEMRTLEDVRDNIADLVVDELVRRAIIKSER